MKVELVLFAECRYMYMTASPGGPPLSRNKNYNKKAIEAIAARSATVAPEAKVPEPASTGTRPGPPWLLELPKLVEFSPLRVPTTQRVTVSWSMKLPGSPFGVIVRL